MTPSKVTCTAEVREDKKAYYEVTMHGNSPTQDKSFRGWYPTSKEYPQLALSDCLTGAGLNLNAHLINQYRNNIEADNK